MDLLRPNYTSNSFWEEYVLDLTFTYGELFRHTEKRKAVSDTYIPNEARRSQNCYLPIHLRLLQHPEDQQLQCRWSPTCGIENFKAALASRRLTPAYPRFWVFSDCTFLDNSSISSEVHQSNIILNNYRILNPVWLMNAVYAIIFMKT